MPSYPPQPTFPIDIRSPSGSLKVGRVGTAVTVDIDRNQVLVVLPVSAAQFFAALEANFPGSVATVQGAVPSDPASAINNAFRSTAFVTPDCTLLAFVRSTLSLTDQQVSALLATAALQPK